jgi:hypothetical protein
MVGMTDLFQVIKPEVLEYFSPWILNEPTGHLFPYKLGTHTVSFEHLSIDVNKVPSGEALWLAACGHPAQARDVFVSFSAAEVLCFCHYQTSWIKFPCKTVFVALGLLPTSAQICLLKQWYKAAKFHMLFDSGISGRVLDCKTALWLAGKDAAFSIAGENICICYQGKDFGFAAESFSLNRFQQVLGLRSGIRTHKPKGGFESYFSQLISKY